MFSFFARKGRGVYLRNVLYYYFFRLFCSGVGFGKVRDKIRIRETQRAYAAENVFIVFLQDDADVSSYVSVFFFFFLLLNPPRREKSWTVTMYVAAAHLTHIRLFAGRRIHVCWSRASRKSVEIGSKVKISRFLCNRRENVKKQCIKLYTRSKGRVENPRRLTYRRSNTHTIVVVQQRYSFFPEKSCVLLRTSYGNCKRR